MRGVVSGLAVVAALGGAGAQAGPDVTTNYLMDEPASMLDIGVLRINMRMSADDELSGFTLSYKFDENVFEFRRTTWILYNLLDEVEVVENPTDEQARIEILQVAQNAAIAAKECEQYIEPLRAWFGTSGGSTLASQYFGHYGYKPANIPDDIYSDLDGKFTIDVLLFIPQKSRMGINGVVGFSCTAPLLGAGFSTQRLYRPDPQ
ncbi:MAG: hypothetical protein COB08_019465 [Rhodobacteraceae bacterium]|nr:hypothetical protein [Paracoccaceae bacterium]